MTTVAEIEAAIQSLPPDKVRELAAWLEQRQSDLGTKAFSSTSLHEVAGSLPYAGPAKTIAEMDAAILAHASKHAL